MKVVVLGEQLRSDLESGTVIYQYPVPKSRINQPQKDANNLSFEISVILSKKTSFEHPDMTPHTEKSDSEIPPGDDALQSSPQETPPDEETQPLFPEEIPPGDEAQQSIPQKASPDEETQPPSTREIPPGDAFQSVSQDFQKKESGKKNKKPHGKGKHGQKTLRNGEMPQPDSEKSQKGEFGKKHKKPHGKDKRKELLITDEVTQTVSQKLQEEKSAELLVEEKPNSSAQPSVADQDNKEQIAPIEDDQTSESLNEASQPTLSSENGQPVDTQELIGAPSNSQESLSTEPLTAEPVEDIEEISPHPSPIAASMVDTEEISAAPTHPKEQIIYLGPDDQLTELLERIAEARARQIILVVPQQTQLRSNVGWRILHARVRDLGMNVQVVSADRQVRAVAKYAGFSVISLTASSGPSRMRPGNQPGRGRIVSNTGQRRLPLRVQSDRVGISAPSEVARTPDEQVGSKPATVIPATRNSESLPANDHYDDPFTLMEDGSSVSLPEQRASSFMYDLDEGMSSLPDIAEESPRTSG